MRDEKLRLAKLEQQNERLRLNREKQASTKRKLSESAIKREQ